MPPELTLRIRELVCLGHGGNTNEIRVVAYALEPDDESLCKARRLVNSLRLETQITERADACTKDKTNRATFSLKYPR
jgi:hypothetical protein